MSLDNIAKEVNVSTGFEDNDFSSNDIPDFSQNIIIENNNSAQPVVTIENKEPNPMKDIYLDKNPIKEKTEIPKSFTPEQKTTDPFTSPNDPFGNTITINTDPTIPTNDPFDLKKEIPEPNRSSQVHNRQRSASRASSVSSGGSSFLEYKAPEKKSNDFFTNFGDIANKSKHKPSADPFTTEETRTGYQSDTSSIFQPPSSSQPAPTSQSQHNPQQFSEANKFMSEDEQKQDFLIKLQSLETRGVRLTREFSMKSRLEEIKFEYEKQKYILEKDQGIDFMKNILVTIVHGIEILNKKFDPIGAKLGGWSESVMENLNSYETIFERLYGKYCDTVDVAPELELLLTLASSAFMYHMMQTVFKTSIPNLGQTMLNNPVLMKEMGRSVAQAADMSGGTPPQQGIPQPSNQTASAGGGGFDFGSILSGLFPGGGGPGPSLGQAFQNPIPRPVSSQPEKTVQQNYPPTKPNVETSSQSSGKAFSVTKRSKSNKKTITF